MTRRVTLEVIDATGEPLGTFDCTVPTPWLQEVSDVLALARAVGLDLSILRLLAHAPETTQPGARMHCTYLAEARSCPPAGVLSPSSVPSPSAVAHAGHPLRLPYARLGGNAADIAWADGQLRAHGLTRAGLPEQQRTWNLSCVHRLPLSNRGHAWLKSVPPFFRQEGAVIAQVQALDARTESPATLALPPLLGHDAVAGRLLLAHCEGPLMWGCTTEDWRAVINAHVDRQWRLRDALTELAACGMPDWRGPSLLSAFTAMAARDDVLADLTQHERSALAALVHGLPARLVAIATCGLPDTLVHGDLHPGNVIASASGPVLLDWGDAGIGHPLLDVPALCHGFDAAQRAEVRALVISAWQARVPAADVAKALVLMAPVMELRQALIYRTFLDGIEPAEHHYHASDVPARVRAALDAAAADATAVDTAAVDAASVDTNARD